VISKPAEVLTPRQLHAARSVIARVRSRVAAELVQASLFGSRARGDARSDSDVDLLLVFRRLPPDREPFATQAERIADAAAARHGVPVSVWCVSLVDLAQGNRTPMLVDALEDAIPLWCAGSPLPAIPFTPRDALGCVRALLQRTEEGSAQVAALLRRGRPDRAAVRLRDDLVRLCTASNLLHGVTRPRRGESVREFIAREWPPAAMLPLLEWAERSFGPDGRSDEGPVDAPPCGMGAAARVVEALIRGVRRTARRAAAALDGAARANEGEDRAEWSLRSQGGLSAP
jgi:hypothetical protein